MQTLIRTLLFATVVASCPAVAQVNPPPADVLSLDASVTSEVAPDLAVITLAVVREGPDVGPMTQDVNATLGKAFAQAKATPGVVASNGGYSTTPRWETRGNQSVRNGWTVRAEIILKSKDFAALGTLVGKLSDALQITGTGFEISPELRTRESNALIERAVRAFQEKAETTTKAFGYAAYSIREVTLGSAEPSGNPRVMMGAVRADKMAAPLPVEAGRVTLTVSVNGSVQMRR